MSEIQIPVDWVAAGHGIPEVCSRHGAPATARKRITIISRVGRRLYPIWLVSPVVFAAAVRVRQKRVRAPLWPFCPTCLRLRLRLVAISVGCFTAATFAFVGVIVAIMSADPGAKRGPSLTVLLVLIGIACLALLAGLGVTAWGTMAEIARARVSPDGDWVLVRDAHADFVQRAATAAAGPPPPEPRPKWTAQRSMAFGYRDADEDSTWDPYR